MTKQLKRMALCLAIAVWQLPVGNVWAASQLSGKLTTGGNQAVKVNGLAAQGGATILPGAEIETPDNVEATVQISGLGSVELAPGTDAKIDFTSDSIKVTLKKGCVVLRTNKGTKGSVVNPDGKLLSTNSQAEEGVAGDADYSTLPAQSPAQSDGSKPRRLPVCGVALASASVGAVRLSRLAFGAILAALAGGTAIITVKLVTTPVNPSPSAPGQ